MVPRPLDALLQSPALGVAGTVELTPEASVVDVRRTTQGPIGVTGRFTRTSQGSYAAFVFDTSPLNLRVHVTTRDSDLELGVDAEWLQKTIETFARPE